MQFMDTVSDCLAIAGPPLEGIEHTPVEKSLCQIIPGPSVRVGK
jgi:hypothetical protein